MSAPPPSGPTRCQPSRRQRLGFRKELLLALAPTVTVLVVLELVEALSRQRLLFASLASSAFLIYLNPEHPVNAVRTLALSQLGAALTGMACFLVFGPGYLSAGTAMVLAIVAMVALDAVHPPAVSTALGFGLQSGNAGNIALFCMALGITVALLGLQRLTLWLLTRWDRHAPGTSTPP